MMPFCSSDSLLRLLSARRRSSACRVFITTTSPSPRRRDVTQLLACLFHLMFIAITVACFHCFLIFAAALMFILAMIIDFAAMRIFSFFALFSRRCACIATAHAAFAFMIFEIFDFILLLMPLLIITLRDADLHCHALFLYCR